MTADIITLPSVSVDRNQQLPQFPEVWDSTIRSAFANCQRKGYWEFIRNKRKSGSNIHLLFGGCFAKGMEIARRSFYEHGLSQPDAITEAILAATDMWERHEGDDLVPQHGTAANKTYAALVDAIDSYFERWSMEDDEIVPLRLPSGDLFIEKTFAFPVDGTSHPLTGNPIIYAGRLDMLGEWNGMYIGVDEKTSTQLGNAWAASWPMRGQLSGYCLTDEHEVLTRDGWINISKVTTNHVVAQWEQNGDFTFIHPTETHSLEYNGPLYNFEGKVSLSATQGHRQPVFDVRSQKLRTFYIEDIPIANQRQRFITTGQANFGMWHPTTKWLQLLVAVQADGHFTDDGAITFNFTKKRKIERLIPILDGCDIKYTVNSPSIHTTIRVSTRNLEVQELSNLLRSDRTKEKKWGKWLLQLDNDSMKTIISEIVHWDGGQDEDRDGWRYFTSVKENAEWISTLACITGYTSSIQKVNFESWTNKSDNWNPAYRVYISPRSMHVVAERTMTAFNGMVYCITVPSSYFLVRKNGRHVVTGNCMGSSMFGHKIRHFHIRGVGILSKDITFAENLQNRADWQIDAWYTQLRKDINRASNTYKRMYADQEKNGFDLKGLHEHWDQNFDSVCSSYGGCSYMDLCTTQSPERYLHNFDDTDWNPLSSRD